MIGQRITRLCKQKGVTLRAACQSAGLKYSTIHAQIANDRAIPFSTVDRLARTFDVPLNYFSDQRPLFQITPDGAENATAAPLEAEANAHLKVLQDHGYNISIDDVLDWLVYENYRLNNFDWIKDRVDLYHPLAPSDIMARPRSVGKNSIAARYMGFRKDSDIERYFARLDPKSLSQIRLSYAEVKPQRYSITDQSFSTIHGDKHLNGIYRKLMAGVSDEKGSPLTLVFCRIITLASA